MFNVLEKYKDLFILPFLLMAAGSLLFFDLSAVCAHTPHDVIDVLELSPTYEKDKTLFVVMSNHLRKSTNGGFSWKELVNGLDNEHRFSSIAISPSFYADKTLFVSSYGDGIYRSKDAGVSWIKMNNGLDTLNINIISVSDVHYDGTVLAAGLKEGLFKTTDGGERWYKVINDVKITAIAFFPEQKNGRILAGGQTGTLYLSKDEGETWQQLVRIPNSGSITTIAICPNASSNDTLFVGTEKRGVFRSNDGGVSFININKGLSAKSNIRSLAISPEYERDSTIFASEWYEAVFCSKDGGDTWTIYNQGVTWDPQANTDTYWSPYYRDLKISKTFKEDRTVFMGGFDGLFRSTDGGKSWQQMETLPVSLIMGLDVSPGNSNDSSIAITTYGGGAYITHDQGLTWSNINKGLSKTRLSDIVFSPNYLLDKMMFSAQRGYLLRSVAGSNKWKKTPVSKKTSWRLVLSSIVRKLRLPGRLHGYILAEREKDTPFATKIAVSPNFESDRTLFFGTRRHGIFKSIDGGLSSSFVWDGMWGTTGSLVISPGFSSDRTVFAGIRGAGVYKTVDGGEKWQLANTGLSFVDKMKQSNTKRQGHAEDTILAISPNYRKDKTLFAVSSRGLFKTINGGDSWQHVTGAAYGDDNFIITLAISPNYANDQQLIVSVKGKGLYRTDDAGTTFLAIGRDLINNNHRIERLVFSESYAIDNTIYAASYEQLFKSTNGGNSWRVIARPVRYENHREVITYEGDWYIVVGEEYSASSVSHSNVIHNAASLNFVGTGVRWVGTASNEQGIANVYFDGKRVAEVDQFSDRTNFMVPLYLIKDLDYGPHSITIEVTNTKNPKSAGYRTAIDAFDILP